MSTDNKRMICNSCKMPVSAMRDRDTNRVVEWVHLERNPLVPHKPVPVPEIEVDYDTIDQVCDLCSAPEVEWVFEVTPTERVVGNVLVRDTAWGACQACTDHLHEHPNITAHELVEFVLTRLAGVDRGKEMQDPKIKDVAHLMYDDLYAMFLDNMTGEVVRVREYFSS